MKKIILAVAVLLLFCSCWGMLDYKGYDPPDWVIGSWISEDRTISMQIDKYTFKVNYNSGSRVIDYYNLFKRTDISFSQHLDNQNYYSILISRENDYTFIGFSRNEYNDLLRVSGIDDESHTFTRY